jgi:hypothetical protein
LVSWKTDFGCIFLQLDGEQRRVEVTDLGVDKMYIKMDCEVMGVGWTHWVQDRISAGHLWIWLFNFYFKKGRKKYLYEPSEYSVLSDECITSCCSMESAYSSTDERPQGSEVKLWRWSVHYPGPDSNPQPPEYEESTRLQHSLGFYSYQTSEVVLE